MKLSLFTDYALRVLMFAAMKEEPFRVEEVTAAYGVSRNHVAKVVQRLAQLGYLRTQRGRGGGAQLGLDALTEPLGRIIRAIEEENPLAECFDPASNTCPISGSCRLKAVLAQGLQAFFAALDQHTLGDLIAGPARTRLQRTLLPPAHPPPRRARPSPSRSSRGPTRSPARS